jgi:small-conductance mechanosensitive channel
MQAKPLIPMDRVLPLTELEPLLVTAGLVLASYLFYKIWLGTVAEHRRERLRAHYQYLIVNGLIAAALWGVFHIALAQDSIADFFPFIGPYLGIVTAIWIARVFIKAARTVLLQYLFFNHMKEGVPILLVNIFTLTLSVVTYGYIFTEVLQLKVMPILATSAVASIVLGLALQDTLGNLFSGIALQLDNPYHIGDWVEVTNGPTMKWTGKVEEITWRATTLIGLSDETITLPNRVIAQALVANFSKVKGPIVRTQIFRLPYECPLELAREAMVAAALSVDPVRQDPVPYVLFTEAGESAIIAKIVYFLDDYGRQWRVNDQITLKTIEALESKGIRLAPNRVRVEMTGA